MEKTLHTGDKLKRNGNLYVLVLTEDSKYLLVDMKQGYRWSNNLIEPFHDGFRKYTTLEYINKSYPLAKNNPFTEVKVNISEDVPVQPLREDAYTISIEKPKPVVTQKEIERVVAHATVQTSQDEPSSKIVSRIASYVLELLEEKSK